MSAPERIWAYAWTGKTNQGQWQTYQAVGSIEYVRADLCTDPALLAEAVEVLRTLRDYVDDASRGHLRYRGRSDISEMAGEDLVMLDNVIAKLENRHG